MLKTKLFSDYSVCGKNGNNEAKWILVDEQINQFLSENELNIELIDIKYTVATDGFHWNKALMIYKILTDE